MSASIGEKLKFFRKRADLSQFELENQVGLANGVVSRIENGVTNPTKETILQVSKFLKLNEIEQNYLIGFTAEPTTIAELDEARAEVMQIMTKPGNLCYSFDERARMVDISDSFLQLLEVPKDKKSGIHNKSMLNLVFNTEFRVIEHISKSKLEEVVYNFLRSYYATTYFFLNDPVIEESYSLITKNHLAKKIWKKVTKEPIYNLQDIEARKVSFNFFGKDVELVFSNTPLVRLRRFVIVEYIPTPELKNIFKEIQ